MARMQDGAEVREMDAIQAGGAGFGVMVWAVGQ
jgi:hypothetical protein